MPDLHPTIYDDADERPSRARSPPVYESVVREDPRPVSRAPDAAGRGFKQ